MAVSGRTLTRSDLHKGMDVLYVQRHMNGGSLEFKRVKVRIVDVRRVVADVKFEGGEQRTVRFNELVVDNVIEPVNGGSTKPALRAVPPAFAAIPKDALSDTGPLRMPPIGAATPVRPAAPVPAPFVHRHTVVVPPTQARPHPAAPAAPRKPATVPPPAPPPAAAKGKSKDAASFDEWLSRAAEMLGSLKGQKEALDGELEKLMETHLKIQEEIDQKSAEANMVQSRIDAIEKLQG